MPAFECRIPDVRPVRPRAPACFLCGARADDTTDDRNPLCPRCEPHRAIVSPAHVIRMTLERGAVVATCVCGGFVSARTRRGRRAIAAQDASCRRHWRAMIAAAAGTAKGVATCKTA